MKKTILIPIMILLAVLCLTASCGTPNTSDGPTGNADLAETQVRPAITASPLPTSDPADVFGEDPLPSDE